MKKKIGIVLYTNPDYYPVTANAIHLLAQDYDITLIGRNHDTPHRQYASNVKVYRLGAYSSAEQRFKIPAFLKFWEYINFVKQISSKLSDSSLIYTYDSFSYVGICLYQKFISKKTPIIYHPLETTDSLANFTSLSGSIQRLERLWLNRANLLIFPDRDRAAYVNTIVKLHTAPIIVPNFPLKSYFGFEQNWETLINKRWQNITLFYRGAISDSTSMKEILASANIISHRVKIKFVGYLNEENAIKLNKFIEINGQSDYFNYLGFLAYEDVQAHTLNSTVGFAFYKNTSFDRVACATACQKIYEYAACGLPTIVSDFPSYQNYLAGESWIRFANPEDPKSIASAIEDILSDFDNYQQMCIAARKAFEEKFNYETVFSPIIDRISKLID